MMTTITTMMMTNKESNRFKTAKECNLFIQVSKKYFFSSASMHPTEILQGPRSSLRCRGVASLPEGIPAALVAT